jgi:hypothetical protein
VFFCFFLLVISLRHTICSLNKISST